MNNEDNVVMGSYEYHTISGTPESVESAVRSYFSSYPVSRFGTTIINDNTWANFRTVTISRTRENESK
jgi:hypothetical protein